MTSPVKCLFSEKIDDECLANDPRHKLFKKLATSLFPSERIEPEASKLKPPKFAVWDYATAIYDHLFDIKQTAEDAIRMGHLRTVDEY